MPDASKLSRFFVSMLHMPRKISASAASGLVLYNRFYKPSHNIDHANSVPETPGPGEAHARV
jgi:hypothetical protein